MPVDDPKSGRTLPKSPSVAEAVEFVESHDLGGYLDSMPEGHFDVRLETRRIKVEKYLYERLDAVAHAKGTDPEHLLATWLKERLETEGVAR